MVANSFVFMLLNNIGISLHGATNRIGEKAFHLLPRLGSRVRIPSPAPDFRRKTKHFEAALWGRFAYMGLAGCFCKPEVTTGRRVRARGIGGCAVIWVAPRSDGRMRDRASSQVPVTARRQMAGCRPVDRPMPSHPLPRRRRWSAAPNCGPDHPLVRAWPPRWPGASAMGLDQAELPSSMAGGRRRVLW